MTSAAPLWAVVLLPPAVLALALLAAVADAALAATYAGRPVSASVASPLQETARLLVQQRRSVPGSDALLGRLAGAGVLVAAMLAAVVVPIGGHALSDLPVGVVWFNTMDILLWALVWLTGWGAYSHLPLVGAYRWLAQVLAYELPLMFALTAPALAAGSLRVGGVVDAQAADGLPYAAWMPISFVVYLLAVVAFAFYGPLSAPVQADIAGGVVADLGGPDRLLVLVGRYALLGVGAAMAVPLFLAGGAGPLLPGWLWTVVKTLAVLAVLVWCRRRLPTVRMDRFTEIGWVILIPATLLQILAVAVVVLVRS